MASEVASGNIRAIDLVEAHIARIEDVNAALNAVVVSRFDAARAEARAIDELRACGEPLPPLAGVPVTIKECLDLEGLPSTFGLTRFADARATRDETHVARLGRAGAVVLGKTNASQLLAFVETDNPVYGRTNNPWNHDRTSGGSSGGEGAIIAAGGSPLGLGTDIGGSVRIPASFCGITSIKPTQRRCPDRGAGSIPRGQQAIESQVGVLARSVDDAALGFRIIATPPCGEAAMPLGDHRAVNVRQLRVGVYTDDGVLSSSPAVRRYWALVEELQAFREEFASQMNRANGGHSTCCSDRRARCRHSFTAHREISRWAARTRFSPTCSDCQRAWYR